MRTFKYTLISTILLTVAACSTHKPMPSVDYVDLDRFMGD